MKTTAKSAKKGIIRFQLLLLALFMLSSCMNNEPPANEVYIKGMAFTPATLTVTVGTTVKWTNKDAVTHTVTSDTGLFDSGNIDQNGTSSHMFSTAGTYNYHCSIHPSMTGKIIVTESSTQTGQSGY